MRGFGRTILFFIFLLLIQLVAPFNAFCEDIKFEHINRYNGLPINSVTCIDQDKDGFIWLGSMQGMVKFDSKNFKNFVFDNENPNSIPGHLVTQIHCSENGLIYITVSSVGFTIFDPKSEIFTTLIPDATNNLTSKNINAIIEDDKNNLWLATSNGLHYFNTQTNTFSHYSIRNTQVEFDSISNYQEYISALSFDKKGNLYLLGHNSTLMYFDLQTLTTTPIHYTKQKQESIFLFNAGQLFFDDASNKLWIATEKNGIFVYDINTKKTINHFLENIIVSQITKINGKIWACTDGHGLTIFDEAGNIERTLQNMPSDDLSISSDAIYYIKQLRDKTVMVGNYATGLNMYNASKYKFNTLTNVGDIGKTLSKKSIMCLEELTPETLLIGTDRGGINLLNTADHSIEHLKAKNGLTDKVVAKTICKINDNSFYLGTYSDGLFKCTLSPNNELISEQITRPNPGIYKHVWALNKIADTAIWIGYLNGGLSIYNPIKNTYKNIAEFTEFNIIKIAEIDNEIWVSAEQKGVYICDKKGNVLRLYNDYDGLENAMGSNYILDIFKDSKANIWFATNDGGLSRLINKEKKTFKKHNISTGFPSNHVSNILEDDKGTLWLSSDIGCIAFNPESNLTNVFDEQDGFSGNNFPPNASFNNNFKTLYFGGVDGLCIFNPNKISLNMVAPQVAITSLYLNNKKIEVGEVHHGNIILNKAIPYLSEINLSHKDDDFTIEFAALHYESIAKNRFKYKLEGFDQEWIDCEENNNKARYTNLKKGNFTFKVIAANPDNVWTEKPTTININIKPSFFQTKLFFVLIAIAFFLLIILYTKFREHKLQKEKDKLKELVSLKTEALLMKAETVANQNIEILNKNQQLNEYNITRDKVFSIIAHDLKSPLNAIISFSDILTQQYHSLTEQEILQYMNIINQTSMKMNDLIINLLYWVNNQIGKITPKPILINLNNLLNEIKQFAEASALYKNIKLNIEDTNVNVFADYEMLLTIIRNIVANSIKFTPKGGIISIKASAHQYITTLIIEDNGVGIPLNKLNTIITQQDILSTKGTDNESGTGLGLHICKEFTKKNGGTFEIESHENMGTKIILTFPSDYPLS